MPGFLRQATAGQARALGPFVSSTDFISPMTGLTIANTDIKLVANGAASANKNAGGGTHRVNGEYGTTFDATDTATVGELDVSVVVATALPVFDKFFVLEEAVYDALFAATAPGYGVTQTGDTYALANGASGFVALKAVVDAISTTLGPAGAGLTAVATAVWASATRLLTAGTNIVLAKGTGLTGLNDLAAVDVRTAVGLASANLDTQLGDLPTNAELATADDTVLAAIAALNNLSQTNIRTAVGLASANLDTQLDALPTASELTTALASADDATLAAIAALNNLSSAQAQTAAAAALTAYPSATTAQVAAVTSTLSALIAALNNLSAAQVNAEVVDALATDTYAEPGQGAPGATISLAAKINYLFKSWRNLKTGDGTTEKLYNDAGTVVDQKATTSEAAGVVTKTEVISGP